MRYSSPGLCMRLKTGWRSAFTVSMAKVQGPTLTVRAAPAAVDGCDPHRHVPRTGRCGLLSLTDWPMPSPSADRWIEVRKRAFGGALRYSDQAVAEVAIPMRGRESRIQGSLPTVPGDATLFNSNSLQVLAAQTWCR
jgi:hypothetical protein